MDKPRRVLKTLRKYRNPRPIADLLASMIEEDMLSADDVHVVLQGLRGDHCSEGAARTTCGALLADFARLKNKLGGREATYDGWQKLVDETTHYVRRVTGGRVRRQR